MAADERLKCERFPRASGYHPEWVLAGVSGAANPLWLTEWLTEALDLRPGMRVLDLGCGRALSSVFLRREFGVQVWATDLWFSAAENIERVRDAGVEDGVFPIRADARTLPFSESFFDAVVSIDAFMYFGTDDLYLNYLARFVKPGGVVGIALAGFLNEIDDPVPEHLADWWAAEMPYSLHSAGWWRRHWQRSGILDVTVADTLPDGWRFWLDWLRLVAPTNEKELRALEADAGRYFGYVRAVGRRRAEAQLFDPLMSIPAHYSKQPLRRGAPDSLVLRRPRPDEEDEFMRAHRATTPDVPNFLHAYQDGMPFSRYLEVLAEHERGVNLPSDHVPFTFLLAFKGERIVGRVSIRHTLNGFLERVGGHIGYAVVPEFRRQGHATEILRLALQIAHQQIGLDRVLVTCDDDNIGSIRTIEKNGGILEDVVSGPDLERPKRRYWIDARRATG